MRWPAQRGCAGRGRGDVRSTSSAAGVEAWLRALREDLVSMRYRPMPVRRVMIPKPGGGERPLGIPTIRDRVAQTAAKLVLEPIFEADFEDSAYGYRPKRSAVDAIKATHRLICRGYIDVVDADLSKYFDTIPHADLLKSVARRIVDRHVLWLIKLWLKAPVEERDGDGTRRMSGGKSNTRGTPQGGVVSPLLADIYMNRFLKHWRLTRTRRSVSRARRLLCRRLRHPQPRTRGRGAGVDEGGDDEARADAQRGENLGEGRPAGKLRLPWLYAGTTPLSEWRSLVSGRRPVQEERAADQDESRRAADAGRTRAPGRRCASTIEPPLAVGRRTSPMAPSHAAYSAVERPRL